MDKEQLTNINNMKPPIDHFTDAAAILNLLDLRSIMVWPVGKKRTSLYISWGKCDHYYIRTQHNDLFSHYNRFLGKRKEKLARKACGNMERVYWIVIMPPRHPIILLKSNWFNMAAVSVKRSINLVGDGCYVVMLGKWTRGFKPIGKIKYFEFV